MAAEPFRLLDLPGEIRNKIYEEILCAFDAPEPELEGLDRRLRSKGYPSVPTGITPATHHVNTAILRTCKQVYREAYDVMVKTNQFVNVEIDGLHISDLLLYSRMPIVTMDREHAKQFKGYFLKMKITCPDLGWDPEDADLDMDDFDPDIHAAPEGPGIGPQFNFMILGRDLDRWCRIFDEGDIYVKKIEATFAEGVTIDVVVNPTPGSVLAYQAPVEEFFTDAHLRALLQPVRKRLRAINKMTVTINSSKGDHRDLANDVVQETMSQRWPNAARAISQLSARKDQGAELYRQRNFNEAREIWSKLSYDLDCITVGPSWPYLLETGGQQVLDDMPKLDFILHLNLAHVLLNDISAIQSTPENSEKRRNLLLSADLCLQHASTALYTAPLEGSNWVPTNSQVVKFNYRRALWYRLMGNDEYVPQAVEHITRAWHLAPRDEAVVAEKENIMEWKRRVNGEVRMLAM